MKFLLVILESDFQRKFSNDSKFVYAIEKIIFQFSIYFWLYKMKFLQTFAHLFARKSHTVNFLKRRKKKKKTLIFN